MRSRKRPTHLLSVPREQWVSRIATSWRASFDAVLEVGRLLTAAKAALAHGEFTGMIEADLPFGSRTAQRLMAIAADPRISNPTHSPHLPPHWGTLYELTKLTDEQFEAGIREKRIRPDMERQEVNGARAIMGSRQEPSDSLDYFPTPPWATRALIDRVFPHLGVTVGHISGIWEPACGEGHIAEVLREYCPVVMATDVFDYGYGDCVCDFLNPGLEDRRAAWVITNPPFGDNAIKFVDRALEVADRGVAMFFRSQWAVEGVERYESIFSVRPPTLCAFFVERVNLCKGRWEPEGSTATAYCWLVWMHGEEPKAPFWIPPGCREDLSRPDDVERFTAHPVAPPDPLEIPAMLRREA